MSFKHLAFLVLIPLQFTISCTNTFTANKDVRGVVINSSEGQTVFSVSQESRVTPKKGKNYYWFKSNMVQITESAYSGSLLSGQYEAFYVNGQLKEKGVFKNGLKHKTWKKFDSSGKLTEIEYWKLGKLKKTETPKDKLLIVDSIQKK